MTKEEVIARIKAINASADEDFLREFSQEVLEAYLKRLETVAERKRQAVGARR